MLVSKHHSTVSVTYQDNVMRNCSLRIVHKNQGKVMDKIKNWLCNCLFVKDTVENLCHSEKYTYGKSHANSGRAPLPYFQMLMKFDT